MYFCLLFRMKGSLEIKLDPDQVPLNPWDVTNLDDFLYYCCPECDWKEKDKQTFVEHAVLSHDHAKVTLQLIKEGGELVDPYLVKGETSLNYPISSISGNFYNCGTLFND